jgi:hypothetical protein
MNRILTLLIVLVAALPAGASDRSSRDPEKISIATTGRIIKVDLKGKTFKVRGSDVQALSLKNVSQNFSQLMQGLKQHIGVTLPGGITIALPGRKSPTRSADDQTNNLDEYVVAITKDTIFQDGGEYLRFEDFKNGDMISIHGSLTGSTVVASRVARWF